MGTLFTTIKNRIFRNNDDILELNNVLNDEPSPSVQLRTYRLLLLGSAGAGKSAFGNLILGREKFKSEPNLTSIVGKSERHRNSFEDVFQIELVNTPGIANEATILNDQTALEEIAQSILLLSDDKGSEHQPGVDAILFVVHLPFTDDQHHILQFLESMGNSWPYIIPVFTNIDDSHGDEKQREYIIDSAKGNTHFGFRWLLHNVEDRFMVVDLRCETQEYKSAKRAELLRYLGGIIAKNRERHTNEMFTKIFQTLHPMTHTPDGCANTETNLEIAVNQVKEKAQALHTEEVSYEISG